MSEPRKLRIDKIEISPNPVNAKKTVTVKVTAKDIIFKAETVYLGEKYVGENIGVI